MECCRIRSRFGMCRRRRKSRVVSGIRRKRRKRNMMGGGVERVKNAGGLLPLRVILVRHRAVAAAPAVLVPVAAKTVERGESGGRVPSPAGVGEEVEEAKGEGLSRPLLRVAAVTVAAARVRHLPILRDRIEANLGIVKSQKKLQSIRTNQQIVRHPNKKTATMISQLTKTICARPKTSKKRYKAPTTKTTLIPTLTTPAPNPSLNPPQATLQVPPPPHTKPTAEPYYQEKEKPSPNTFNKISVSPAEEKSATPPQKSTTTKNRDTSCPAPVTLV